jgi:uncharacterized repeat protein (TIGR01451 family)
MIGIGQQRRWLVALGGGLCLIGVTSAGAAGLRLRADQSVPAVSANQSAIIVRVSNDGPGALSELRLHAPADVQFSCQGTTESGRAFTLGGNLASGDSATCQAVASMPGANPRSMGLAVTARSADGQGQLQHASVTSQRGSLTPAQGAVVLMGGSIHADANSDGRLDAGETLSYHYTVLNVGSVALSGVAVSDLAGTVNCPQSTLAVNTNMICTRLYTVTAGDQANGLVVNDVRVIGTDASARPVQGGDVIVTLNLAGTASVRVFKSPLLLNDVDASGFASLGDLLRYTFVVKNSNAQTLTAVNLVEPDPTRIDTPIVCAPTTLGGAPFSGIGSGSLVANDTVLCTADYTVRVSDRDQGQALNLVLVLADAQVAGQIINSGASAVVVPGGFLISVAKSVNLTAVFPGDTVIYTVVVTNPGTLPVANVSIIDPLPIGVAGFSWTCAGASCPNPSGTGGIFETIPSFPAGAQIIYTVAATISDDPPGSIVNIVTITPPTVVECLPGNTPPPCSSSVPIEVVPRPNPVPSASLWSLLLLALALSGFAAVHIRRD